MANEISLDIRMTMANGNSYFNYSPGTNLITQAAIGGPTPGYVTIGTAEESVAFPELGTEGICIIENLDTTNYVQIGFSTGIYGARLKPGEAMVMRLEPNVALFLKANTAACKVNIMAFED